MSASTTRVTRSQTAGKQASKRSYSTSSASSASIKGYVVGGVWQPAKEFEQTQLGFSSIPVVTPQSLDPPR